MIEFLFTFFVMHFYILHVRPSKLLRELFYLLQIVKEGLNFNGHIITTFYFNKFKTNLLLKRKKKKYKAKKDKNKYYGLEIITFYIMGWLENTKLFLLFIMEKL